MFNGVFERLLVVSPHCDDEVLGCGGLMKKVVDSGGDVTVVVAAVGDTTFYHLNRVVTAEERKAELRNALDYLGIKKSLILFEGYESKMDVLEIRKIVSVLDELIEDIQPTAVLIPYPSFHQDHKIVFDASFAALRPSPTNSDSLRMVAMYEYPFIAWNSQLVSGGSFYLDIESVLTDKIEALKKHESQVREGRHMISPESVKLWAEKRGLEAGLNYAELFYILRLLI